MAAHTPVLTAEVLELLRPRAGGRYLDATVGLGGHAAALLDAAGPDATLVGLDRDAEVLTLASGRLAAHGTRVRLLHGRYEAMGELLPADDRFDGILFDLGVSSAQLDTAERGFAFMHDGPLDMRMDRSQGETAAELLARLTEHELADLIFQFGEERWSRRIARRIVEAQAVEPIRTTGGLAQVVGRAIPRARWPRGIHPATRTFQALRIAVNEELAGLGGTLEQAAELLAPGGRLVAISFHSLEDRIVKQTWRGLAAAGRVHVLTKRPIGPGEAEAAANPRSRSAKLRAVERPMPVLEEA